ncbi:AEC family transporter [Pseudooceanicola aestuarii]|uniref:AEC family transporter n=1 Tax=Pseudooceanicola aestuarii TaxID=2697319 RepID=UPI0013D6C8F5|nr:AEC family transporter [Pseudooceanicola aestuarii]
MLNVLSVTLPIFAIIALGYGLTLRGVFAPEHMQTLGRFVLQVSLPALLFYTFATRDLGEVLDIRYLIAVGTGAAATQAVAWTVMRVQGLGPMRRAVAVMGTGCSNSAFIGYPMLLIVMPEVAAPVLAMNFLVENFIGTPIGLTLLEAARPNEGASLLKRVGRPVLSVLRRPMVIGLLLGLAFTLTGLPLPATADRFLSLLSAPAAPIALFVIGGTLVGLEMRGDVKIAGQIAAIKLIVHPLMIWLCLGLPVLFGLGALSPELVFAALLTGVLPMYTIYTILAQDSGHSGLAAMALVGATAASFFTISLVLLLYL